MEEKIKKMRELVDEIAKIAFDTYPNATRLSVTADGDGYLTIGLVQWDEDIETSIESRRRRELLDQSRYEGEWSEDKSTFQNEYYKKIGCLLEEESA